jgi:hypothetical protein
LVASPNVEIVGDAVQGRDVKAQGNALGFD